MYLCINKNKKDMKKALFGNRTAVYFSSDCTKTDMERITGMKPLSVKKEKNSVYFRKDGTEVIKAN